jgi:hypothetical protein
MSHLTQRINALDDTDATLALHYLARIADEVRHQQGDADTNLAEILDYALDYAATEHDWRTTCAAAVQAGQLDEVIG